MIIDLFILKDQSIKRHVAKTITWRILGTIDTMAIGWIITGNVLIGLKIGGVEMITKMILYFIHERLWYRSNIGLPHRKSENNE